MSLILWWIDWCEARFGDWGLACALSPAVALGLLGAGVAAGAFA